MPAYVIKCNPDEDLYVYWSEITESPYCWGDRETIKEYLIRNSHYYMDDDVLKDVEERIARADENGTSAFAYKEAYGWEDDGILIFMQKGFLRRHQLKDFIYSYNFETGDFDESMLEPFEDDEEYPV